MASSVVRPRRRQRQGLQVHVAQPESASSQAPAETQSLKGLFLNLSYPVFIARCTDFMGPLTQLYNQLRAAKGYPHIEKATPDFIAAINYYWTGGQATPFNIHTGHLVQDPAWQLLTTPVRNEQGSVAPHEVSMKRWYEECKTEAHHKQYVPGPTYDFRRALAGERDQPVFEIPNLSGAEQYVINAASSSALESFSFFEPSRVSELCKALFYDKIIGLGSAHERVQVLVKIVNYWCSGNELRPFVVESRQVRNATVGCFQADGTWKLAKEHVESLSLNFKGLLGILNATNKEARRNLVTPASRQKRMSVPMADYAVPEVTRGDPEAQTPLVASQQGPAAVATLPVRNARTERQRREAQAQGRRMNYTIHNRTSMDTVPESDHSLQKFGHRDPADPLTRGGTLTRRIGLLYGF